MAAGVADPDVVILENTLGFVPTFPNQGTGNIGINHTGGFPFSKVWVNNMGDFANSGNPYITISDGNSILGYYTITIYLLFQQATEHVGLFFVIFQD